MDLQCGAGRHPSSPFALSGPSVGQRGIFARTTQLLVPTALNYLHILMLFNISLHFGRSFASSCHSGTCNSLNSGFTRRTSLHSTAASSATSAVSSANSPSLPSSHRPSFAPLLQLLLVAYCVDAGVTRRRARPLRLSPSVRTCGVGGSGLGGGGATFSGRCRCGLGRVG